MLRTKQVLSIFLLFLLRHMAYNEAISDIPRLIAKLSSKLGTCANYFEYLQDDFAYVGKLILPDMKQGDSIKLEIKGKEMDRDYFNGTVLLDESTDVVMKKIENKQPLSFRVDFPFTTDTAVLNKIFINGKELCSTSGLISDEIPFGINSEIFKTKYEIDNGTLRVVQFNPNDEIPSGTYSKIIETTLEIINGSLPVFKFNPIIPHFRKFCVEGAICGLADEKVTEERPTQFIYKGTEIRRGEYPWMAAIYKNDRTGIAFVCSGTLVTSEIIVTAAHCFKRRLTAKRIIVYLGRHSLTDYLEDGTETREINELILHPDYNNAFRFPDADMALLKMKSPVGFTRFIKPICLWSESADEELIVNNTAVVAGWGSDEDDNVLTDVPKKVRANIVSENECLRSHIAYNNLTSSRTLCAGNRDGSGPCEGDSGSGLMLQRNGRWMLRGIVSAGLKDVNFCDLLKYTIYCDVAKHMSWLSKYVPQREQEISDDNYRPITGPATSICGKSGTERRNAYPWLAAIYKKYSTGMQFECSGALISSRSVLVSGICMSIGLDNVNDFRVFLGRYDLNSVTEDGVVARDLKTIIHHPNYEGGLPVSRLAILQMKEPNVVFTQYVKPICFWSEVPENSQLVGKSATLLNYDKMGVRTRTFAVPQASKVVIIPDENCEKYFSVISYSRLLCIPHLIAEDESGLLMIERSGQWELRGIKGLYSFFAEEEGDLLTNLTTFTDIIEYLPWIQIYL